MSLDLKVIHEEFTRAATIDDELTLSGQELIGPAHRLENVVGTIAYRLKRKPEARRDEWRVLVKNGRVHVGGVANFVAMLPGIDDSGID